MGHGEHLARGRRRLPAHQRAGRIRLRAPGGVVVLRSGLERADPAATGLCLRAGLPPGRPRPTATLASAALWRIEIPSDEQRRRSIAASQQSWRWRAPAAASPPRRHGPGGSTPSAAFVRAIRAPRRPHAGDWAWIVETRGCGAFLERSGRASPNTRFVDVDIRRRAGDGRVDLRPAPRRPRAGVRGRRSPCRWPGPEGPRPRSDRGCRRRMRRLSGKSG